MPRANLTDIIVRTLKPMGYATLWDTQLRGFGIRCGLSSKTWVVMVGKHRQRITVGRYPDMTLKEARAAGKALLSRTYTATPSLASTIDSYCNLHLAPNTKPRSAKEAERLLRRHFIPLLGTTRLGDITARDITAITNKMAATPTEANLALAAMKALLNWSASQYLIPQSPLASVRMPFKKVTRDRVLNDTELAAILRAPLPTPFAGLARCLIHTGQRRQQFAALKWTYIENDCIAWPKEDMKANRAHVIPLTPAVKQIIESLPRVSHYVFPSAANPHEPFSSWSHSMDDLRRLSGIHARFTAHDWRRTASTNLHRLGVMPNVVEHLLSHSQPKIAGIYNRYQYQDEMRDALLRYEQFLADLTYTVATPRLSTPVPAEQTSN